MLKRCVWSVMMGLLAMAGMAKEYYVSPSGNDANDGASWGKAKRTIQAAVNAGQDGDTVRVADGAYVLTGAITITKAITVCSVNGAAATVVNGGYPAKTNSCFKLYHSAAVIDGFTITNAYDRAGCDESGEGYGGVYVNPGIVQNCLIAGNVPYGVAINNGLIQSCTISGNEVGVGMNEGTVQLCQISSSSQEGILIYQGGKALNCTITGNAGSGVYNEEGTVQNCTISYNTCGSTPSGVWNRGLVQNCLIVGNYGGGGVYNRYGGVVRNCVIAGNQTRFSGGGVMNELGTVQNCSIVGNDASIKAGGLYNYRAEGYVASGMVENCVVYFNSAPSNSNYEASSNTVNQFICADPVVAGAGNFADNPLFINAGTGSGSNYAAGDLRLQAGSPCINAGTNRDWMTGATDIAGNSRILDGRADLGAYEYNGTNQTPTPAIDVTVNGESGSVIITYGTPVSVKVALTPVTSVDIQADWWVVASTPAGWYYLAANGQWTAAADIESITPVYQGSLIDLTPTEVLNHSSLPSGAYTFFFGVDLMNGQLDIAGLWYDAVNLIVQ